MYINASAPLDYIDRAIEAGPDYMRPILLAVRDDSVSLWLVPPGQEPISPPGDAVSIVIVCDDWNEPLGPNGFHKDSVGQFIERCDSAVIVACEPVPDAYALAAAALLLNRNVLLVETQTDQEENWASFIESHRPDISLIVATV
jgi:hypothetical protein